MKLIIAKIDETIFEGEFEYLSVPTKQTGHIQILPNHAPLISVLKEGILKYKAKGGKEEKLEIKKGIVEVSKNEVLVIL
ncbi:hypothetical protein CSB11_01160 [Candidatus Campbellbacteria bacterium]|nr:MAG: hypothetical protein CSB11_01160 [Candidatus Campbellbacteria bacterium]